MRLKQLEIQGFKSFPHRTVVDFAPGLTAIVGPNGCGKSNVVDAIRWVLGEQSARLLRGAQMDDVLFKGSDQLPPSNMAEVSLMLELDETPERLEALDEDSIAAQVLRQCGEAKVTRRLYRSGEAEYLLNGRPCRLRDITEMFLGSGVGARSYAIIEQGKVDQLIVAKPEDRRAWIEEAAGTTLFRARKLAAERKMERTRENLQRVTDILRELERQLNYMRRLAKRAEQARAIESEVRRLELVLTVREKSVLEQRIAEKDQELASIVASYDVTKARLAEARELLDASRSDERRAFAELSSIRERRIQLETELAGVREQILLAGQQRDETESRRRGILQELATIRGEVDALAQVRTAEAQRRCQLAAQILALEFRREVALRARRFAGARLAVLKSDLEQVRNRDLMLRQQRSELENEARSLSKERGELVARTDSNARELRDASSKLATVERELLHCKRVLRVLEERQNNVALELETRRQRVKSLSTDLQAMKEETDALAEECLRLRSRLDAVDELRRRYEGFKPSVQKFMLGENGHRLARAVVAEVLDVPAKFERAVAAALGELLQCMIVDGDAETLAAVNRLRETGWGRGWFIALGGVSRDGKDPSTANGHFQRLVEVVRCEEPYRDVVERLFARVALVPTLEDALDYHRKVEGDYLLVTPSGESVDQRGVVSGGTETLEPGEELLARRRLVQELTELLRTKSIELRKRQEACERLSQSLEGEQETLRRLESERSKISLQIVGARKDADRWQEERKILIDRVEHATRESARLLTRLAEVDDRARELSQHLEALEAVGLDAKPRSQLLQRLCVEAEGYCRELDGKIRQWDLALARARERHEASVRTLVRLDQQESALHQRVEALSGAARASSAQQEQTASLLSELGARQARLEEQIGDLLRLEAERDRDVTQLVSRRELAERTLQQITAEVDTIREAKARVEMELVESRSQMESLRQSVFDRYHCTLEEITADEVAWADEELREKLEELRSTLARIGAVGFGVVEEVREIEERAQFLRAQKADLERALKDVQGTIERLDSVSRVKFLAAFEAIRERFSQVMPRLFGGGEGRLVLTDSADSGTAGVDIVVRPPGKRLEAVALLSGGEKALAAVALIFALFSWRPSPFCILDEVDAPLDDANVHRFMELVREMTATSQFLVITHNKRTMQVADRLYGVTMQQPGVSTVLAVELQ